MEVDLKPFVLNEECNPTFENVLKSGKLQEYLARMPSAFIKAYSALGKTRLMTLCISANRFEVNEYLVCMLSNDFVNSTLWELGLIYYDAWEYAGQIRKLSRKIKRQLQELKKEMDTDRRRSLFETLTCWTWSNYNRKRKRERDFVDSIEGILKQGTVRCKDGDSLLKKLNVIYEKYAVIKRRMSDPQYATLPDLAGFLVKDLIHDIALPDLRLCFSFITCANDRIRKLEYRWMIWKESREELTNQKKIYFLLSFMVSALLIFYVIR